MKHQKKGGGGATLTWGAGSCRILTSVVYTKGVFWDNPKEREEVDVNFILRLTKEGFLHNDGRSRGRRFSGATPEGNFRECLEQGLEVHKRIPLQEKPPNGESPGAILEGRTIFRKKKQRGGPL